MNERDERLGRAVRSLPVPDHAPDFFPRLATRLEQETGPRRLRWRPPTMLTLAAAAVVLVVVAAASVLTRDGGGSLRPGPTPGTRLISATEVRGRVSTAFSALHTLRGEVTVECAVTTGNCSPPDAGGRTTLSWSFVTTAAGDERVTGIGRQDDVAYSASRREQRSVGGGVGGGGGGEPAEVITNLPPGPPDFAARRSVLQREVASVVRAFLGSTGDVPVTEVTEQDRSAWRLVAPVTPNKLAGPGASGDQLEVVVDRETGFPLRVTETLAGRFLDEVRLSKLVVDAPADPATFVLDVPVGGRTFRQDVGFRAVTLDQVAVAVGYRPVLPSAASLPAGFQLAEVTVATTAQATGNEGANPPSRNVVSVAYRRGFDRIVVTTRSTGTSARCSTTAPGAGTSACWADPLASGEGFVDQPQPFTVGGGSLAGARGEMVVSARGLPHVWTIDSRLVTTVGGDATPDELRRMAESFAPAA